MICRLMSCCNHMKLCFENGNYIANINDNTNNLFGGDRISSEFYIDSLLVNLYKLTEIGGGSYPTYGIRIIKEFCRKLADKYKISQNCSILTTDIELKDIDKPIVIINDFQQSFQGKEYEKIYGTKTYNSAQLVTVQENELKMIDNKVKSLRQLRCKEQAHSDLNYLNNTYGNVSVNDLVHSIANGEYIHKTISDHDLNDLWNEIYQVYTIIRNALNRCALVLLSVYSRSVDDNGMVRVLPQKDIENIMWNTFL